MKKRKYNLYLLYQFKEPSGVNTDIMNNVYFTILLFSELGELGDSELKKVIPEYNSDEDLSFRTKSELVEFAQNCLANLDFHSVYLLASQDYNIGIESCHDLSSFREIFHRYGEHISHGEVESKEKNIFGKLF